MQYLRILYFSNQENSLFNSSLVWKVYFLTFSPNGRCSIFNVIRQYTKNLNVLHSFVTRNLFLLVGRGSSVSTLGKGFDGQVIWGCHAAPCSFTARCSSLLSYSARARARVCVCVCVCVCVWGDQCCPSYWYEVIWAILSYLIIIFTYSFINSFSCKIFIDPVVVQHSSPHTVSATKKPGSATTHIILVLNIRVTCHFLGFRKLLSSLNYR